MTSAKHSLRLESSVLAPEAAPKDDPRDPHAAAARNDRELVAAVLAGDPEAALELYQTHAENVRRLLWQLLGPDPELEDVTQQVFLAVADSLHRLDKPGSLGSWIVGITIRTARREIRRRQKWRRHRDLSPQETPESTAPSTAADQHRVTRTLQILDTLDPAERIAFVLRYAEGYRLGEIATACDCSLATVKRRIGRARSSVHALAQQDFWLAPLLEEQDDG